MSIGLQWVSHFVLSTIHFPEVFLVLHPRHKLQYFKKAGWEETWIETSRDIVRTEFDRTYAFMDIDFEANDTEAPTMVRRYIFLIHPSSGC